MYHNMGVLCICGYGRLAFGMPVHVCAKRLRNGAIVLGMGMGYYFASGG